MLFDQAASQSPELESRHSQTAPTRNSAPERKLARSGAQLEQILAACSEETLDAGPYVPLSITIRPTITGHLLVSYNR